MPVSRKFCKLSKATIYLHMAMPAKYRNVVGRIVCSIVVLVVSVCCWLTATLAGAKRIHFPGPLSPAFLANIAAFPTVMPFAARSIARQNLCAAVPPLATIMPLAHTTGHLRFSTFRNAARHARRQFITASQPLHFITCRRTASA